MHLTRYPADWPVTRVRWEEAEAGMSREKFKRLCEDVATYSEAVESIQAKQSRA